MKHLNKWKYLLYITLLFVFTISESYSMGSSLMSASHTVKTPQVKPKVAIIGAGLSGLTMGHKLAKKGYHVSIFEARNRVGGRVHSIYVKNAEENYSLAELGGHNITDGGEAKHFLELAKVFGLEIEEDPRHLTRGFYADKSLYSPNQLLEQEGYTQEKLDEIVKCLSLDTTVQTVLDKLFSSSPILKRTFSYYVGSYEGLPCSQLPLSHNLETLKYFLPGGGAASPDSEEGSPFLLKHIRGGNSRLPQAMAESLKDNVFLNKVLKRVSKVEDKIKLEFEDSAIEFCDKLILANPCGTFRDITWEDSVIPADRLDNLVNIEYGANGKVIIPNSLVSTKPPFHSVFEDHFGFLESSDYKLLVGYSDGVWGQDLLANIKSYYPLMLELAEKNYGPIKAPGDILPVPASEIIFEKYERPVIKSWFEDPYAKGSYSAVGTGLGKKFLETTFLNGIEFKTLFTPIEDQVFFIGEHTSIVEERGTMEAAIESAIRVSDLFK